MRLALAALLLVIPLSIAAADTATVLADADSLHDQGAYARAAKLLLDSVPSASGGKEQAELYWRAARETLELGDQAEKDGKPTADVLAVFTEGEGYADKAIASDPQNDLGYYWKSANIGRWGQVKGVVNSLFKAATMKDLLLKELSLNPERSDPYYVLGELYRELPGWPVSFGNLDAAVSLGRKAVDLRQAQVENGSGEGARVQFLHGACQDPVQAQLVGGHAVGRAEEQGGETVIRRHAVRQGGPLRGRRRAEGPVRP